MCGCAGWEVLRLILHCDNAPCTGHVRGHLGDTSHCRQGPGPFSTLAAHEQVTGASAQSRKDTEGKTAQGLHHSMCGQTEEPKWGQPIPLACFPFSVLEQGFCYTLGEA